MEHDLDSRPLSASARLAWSIARSGTVLIAASLLLLAANLSITSLNVLAALAIEVDALASLAFGLVVTLHAKDRHVGWGALALGLAWAVVVRGDQPLLRRAPRPGVVPGKSMSASANSWNA